MSPQNHPRRFDAPPAPSPRPTAAGRIGGLYLIGYLLIGGLLVLLVPLGPFIIVAWLLLRLRRALTGRSD